ncbi:tRNA(adenine34) deaminase [Naganishia albida]|nr:tRNA(adenine34) deaminase [Naganishia albida]
MPASEWTPPLATYVPIEEQAEQDLQWMKVALDQAEEALAAKEVPVGCVFVKDGLAIAKARNRTNEWRNATLHAELVSLDQILKTHPLPLHDVTLYVTVEPCVMCASALRQVGIGKVFYGAGNERFGGCGSVLDVNDTPRIKSSISYQALGGYYRPEAIMLLRRFYLIQNSNAPKPKNKTTRVLKTDILPIKSRTASPSATPEGSRTPV